MEIRKTIRRKVNTAKIVLTKVILAFLKKFYFPGKKYFCPCCGHTLRRFMHYDYKSIPSMNPVLFKKHHKQIQCPYCNSLPRHRIMATFFQRHPELLRNKKIVIFGMLQGEKTFFEHHKISYISADLCSADADIKEDLTHLTFTDHSVDVLICHHVLEHVNSVSKALGEIRRVLKADGIAILSVPMDLSLNDTLCDKKYSTPFLRRKYYGQTDHLRLFGRNFAAILQKEGFKVHVINGTNYPARIRPVVGPASTDQNLIFICRK